MHHPAVHEVAKVVPARFSATETLDIGMDLGSTVSKSYTPPHACPTRIHGVSLYLK